ncbi:MAG TPA: protein kinase [Thermoanaerobaculia bacterium]|nr:protein kinase [Thermoanaerobaculia bacterium]
MEGLCRAGWQRLEEILDRALDLETAERAAFVGKACGGDEALRAEVEAFLAADARRHPILDGSFAELAEPLLRALADTTLQAPRIELIAGTRLGRYEIVSRAGVGGMGEVYRAKDLELGRDVAIKVLQAEAAADSERVRQFEQEARAASALNHPNIVTVHGIGEERGMRYIVMEHVEGRTLRELLAAGPLPIRDLLGLASQMASGIAKAHAAGIVHLDLKPENVMFSSDGFAKILDFGLTKLMSPLGGEGFRPPPPSAEPEEARPRRVLGTVGYMSPEQVKGESVDLRSDQFSLGVILHEMATGRQAFRRETATETLSAILESAPEPPLHLDLPSRFRSLVERCLAKGPDQRFGSTRELARVLLDLHEQSLGSAERSSGGGRLIDSLAILPLVDLNAEPGEGHFADGMTEALIADLARLGAVRVISRTSVMLFKGTAEPLSEVARKLGVEGIVEGSVLRAGDRVRITAKLVHAPTDSHIWAQSYERELGDVLALQGDLARAIASEIHVRLDPQEQTRLERRPAISPEAHEHYLLGRYLLNRRTTVALEKSLEHFERAIEMVPDYTLAYSGLADSLALLAGAGHGASVRGLVDRARQSATKALELDESLPAVHTSLAFLRFKFDWDWPGAEAAFRRALELSPSDASAHHWFALYLTAMARHEVAEVHVREAQRLDPLSLIIRAAASRVLQLARDYDRAIAEGRKALELDPGYAEAHFNLGMCWLAQSMYEEAIEALERAIALAGDRPLFLAVLGNALARSGRCGEALRILGRLEDLAKGKHASPAAFAILHLGLGEAAISLDWIEKAVEVRDGQMVFLKVEPLANSVRAEPRFTECLRRMGLAPGA